MSSHRSDRRARRRRLSRRSRALLSLAAVAALAVGLGTQGTLAYFTDSGTVQTGSFTAGTLDITLNGALAGSTNSGGTTTLSAFTLGAMVPGESTSQAFPVANVGSVGLTYTISGSATGALAPGMQYAVYAGASAAATNTGTAAAGNRTGTCTGASLATGVVLTSTAAVVVGTARSLAATSGTENICVVATLATSADNSLQGATTTASLIFNAKQVGAP